MSFEGKSQQEPRNWQMDRILIILKKGKPPKGFICPCTGLNTIIFKHVYWYMQQTQVSVYRTIGPLVYHRLIMEMHEKNLLCSSMTGACIFDNTTMSCGALHKSFQSCPLGQIWPHLGGHYRTLTLICPVTVLDDSQVSDHCPWATCFLVPSQA